MMLLRQLLKKESLTELGTVYFPVLLIILKSDEVDLTFKRLGKQADLFNGFKEIEYLLKKAAKTGNINSQVFG